MNAVAPSRARPDFSACVYCGSRPGHQSAYTLAAEACGRDIAQRGWGLVYGGGSTGLMGTAANAALAHGGHVTGIIPQRLDAREIGHPSLDELHVVDSMHDRKRLMAERSDVFIALPGGIGTLEEIFEIWTWRQLGYHHKPLGLLNVAGYFDDLLRFIDRSQAEGFLWPDVHELLLVDDDAPRLLDRLAEQARLLQAGRPAGPDLAPGT